jgi:hypothetical protein
MQFRRLAPDEHLCVQDNKMYFNLPALGVRSSEPARKNQILTKILRRYIQNRMNHRMSITAKP